MTIKAIGQIDVVDVTDAYNVILTSEAHTFPGSTTAALAGSTTTQIIAMRGSTQVAASVDLASVVAPTGVTVTKDSDATEPTLTIAVSTAVTTAGTVTIPVYIAEKDVTIEKIFSFAIAFVGSTGSTGATGPKGDAGSTGATGAPGADALTLVISSSAGTIFKNSAIVTAFTAHVFKGALELTSSTNPTLASQGTIKWYKDGNSTAVGTGQTLSVTAGTVANKATYVAKLEG